MEMWTEVRRRVLTGELSKRAACHEVERGYTGGYTMVKEAVRKWKDATKEVFGPYVARWKTARCAVMQGGQGDIKHWAFNDPLRRDGPYRDAPPSPADYRSLSTRVVELHPVTLAQNARTSGGGNITMVPQQAITVGPVQTWQAEKVSIWQAGVHDNPLGQRLTALMISKGLADSAVPMSLLADHPNVQFNYYRGGLGSCAVEMH